jgi:hypothetical protein
MRAFRVSNVLLAAMAGSAMTLAGTAAPAQAEGLGAAIAHFFGFGGSSQAAVASSAAGGPPGVTPPPPSLTSQVAPPLSHPTIPTGPVAAPVAATQTA